MIYGNWFSVRKASKCRGRFPRLFSYPGELRDSPTRRSEPLLAEQPPREVQHENALPGIGLVPRAGDENLRERIPDGQQRRELPLGFETRDVFKFRN